ncbi:hypothetical protein N7468_000678 [Penicillium chermesinum]|uniref:Uncharacterized protein n=1 Tax=Penicillium chermesinum TaxID=63820 RepID=A0A9W9PKS8_9EURO|nr:uncharacterized protein N7468_000678 [Penicillium chermesinum]KAJ5249227.1 hypothetical protein N7468_000678 [Penicillium chermesinum]KAJ6151319.1 hypothetical protein N7470_007913 [Penicillium chermesinum]
MSGKKITEWFDRPKFAIVNQNSTPEKKPPRVTPFTSPSSSALTEPTSSFLVDLTSDNDANDNAVQESIRNSEPPKDFSTAGGVVPPPKPEPEIASVSSTFVSDGISSSQRILKDGKEVVISSDGEESDDSSSSFEDPALFFDFKSKPAGKSASKTSMTKLPVKKYKNTMDSLVIGAVDDIEEQGKVAKSRAALTSPQQGEKVPRSKESILASVLGGDDEGPSVERILNAVRRTEALDVTKTWRFLDHAQTPGQTNEFPTNSFPPHSHLAALRDFESRSRMLQSGVLEFAAKLQRLPDEFLLWLFCSVSLERREDLRSAYCRIFSHTSRERVMTLIRPHHIDELFQNLGAKPEALDPSHVIVENSEHSSHPPSPRHKELFLSAFAMLRESAELLAPDARAHAIHVLLRITVDGSLITNDMIQSGLQTCLTALLDNVAAADVTEMNLLIGKPIFETVPHAEFLSCMLENMLPTMPWISLLRYRLVVAFLLRNPEPLTESPEVVVDLKRLTHFLARDERFHAKSHQANETYDYGELLAIAMLLEVAVTSAPYDMICDQKDAEERFNGAVDKFASQVKLIFSSIKDTGASHLKRMVAKEALESLHYRALYSVRTKPAPRKSYFGNPGRQRNHDIKGMFQKMRDLPFHYSPTKDRTASFPL